MPFDSRGLVPLLAADSFTLWQYDTPDSRAAVLAPGYFAAADGRLAQGHLMVLRAADGLSLLPIRGGAEAGNGLVLDSVLAPTRLSRTATMRFGLNATVGAVPGGLLLVDAVAATQSEGGSLAVAATVSGAAQVTFRILDAAGATRAGPVTAAVSAGRATASLSLPAAGSGYRVQASGGGGLSALSNGFEVLVAPAAALPFRLPILAATVSGSTGDAAAGSAIQASAAARSTARVSVAPQSAAVLRLRLPAIGAHGAEIYFTNEVNPGSNNWSVAGRRSADNPDDAASAAWSALPGLPSGAAWTPWAPSGAPSTVNERAQAFHLPAGPAGWVELTLGNAHATATMLWDFRGVRDLNSDARLVVGVAGNSNAVSAENHRDWIAEINALRAGADPMVLDLHRGSASVNEIRSEQVEPFLARFPRFTHLVHAENSNSADAGPFLPVAAPVVTAAMQQHLDWYDGLYDLYAQHPGKVFVGPMEAVLNLAVAATDPWRAVTGEANRTAGKFSEWNLHQRCADILARPSLRATSWDEALGCMKGGWDLFRLEDFENILGPDGVHASGTTPNARTRRGSRFAFAAIAGTAYKAPIVQLLEEAEAAGTLTAARRARLSLLLDYLDAYTPGATASQSAARAALRTRLAAIGTGTGGGGTTTPSVTGSIADVPNNSATAGQAITLAVSRAPAGASYVTLVNHDAEVQRVQLASGAASVTLTPDAASASGRFYAARFYDAATGELIDEVAPFVVVAAAAVASAPVSTAPPAVTGTARQGYVLSASTGSWTGSPTAHAYQWKRGGTAIGGATAATYALVAADVGQAVSVTVTATNAQGSTAATSAATAAVAAPVAPTVVTPPVLTSTGSLTAPRVGDVLTAADAVFGGEPPARVSGRRWRRGPQGGSQTSIPNAVTATYTIVAEDVGLVLDHIQTSTNNGAGAVTAYIARTGVVSA